MVETTELDQTRPRHLTPSEVLIRQATLAGYDVLDTAQEPAYESIVMLAAGLFGADYALITLVDAERIWLKAAHGIMACEMTRSGTMCEHVVRTRQGLTLCDAAADPRFTGAVGVAGPPHVRFYAGVPLLTAEGICLGSLCVMDRRAFAPPAEATLTDLERLATLVMQLLELRKARLLLHRLSERAARVEKLQAEIAAAPSCEAALTHLLAALCRTHRAAIGRIWKLILPTEVMLEVSRYRDENLDTISYFDTTPREPVTAHNSFTAASIRNNRPTMLRYSEVETPESYALVTAAVASGMSCQVSYPIWVEGQYFGIAMAFRADATDLAGIIDDIASLEDLIRPALRRKVAEERLLLLGTALDRAGDGVLITDVGLEIGAARVIYANAGFCQLSGYSQSEIIGQPTMILRGVETDADVVAEIDQAMREFRPIRTELQNYRKDGTAIWVELDLAPLTNADGVITHWVSSRRDITQRRFDALAALRHEKLRSVGQLTGGIAHDFNNLLTVVTLNLEEALRLLPEDGSNGKGDGSSLREMLLPALHAAGRGAELIGQLLSYARRAPLQPSQLNLSTLLTDLRTLLARSLGELFELRLRVDDTQLTVHVDGGQFENAVTNLVINARDAMPKGGMIAIEVRTVELDTGSRALQDDMTPGRYARITVTDHGSGIAAGLLARVFDPFFTTKEVGQGSGLGLSMVYGFARQSGGAASIHSTVGVGTAASLLLPAGSDVMPEKRAIRRTDMWRAAGRSVLVVEDQPEVLATVLSLLEHLDFKITGTSTADEALMILRAGTSFDLLFTDIVLPGFCNGLDLARHARGLAASMKILITSGYTQESQPLSDCIQEGAHLLSKPYRRQELIDKLRLMFP